MATHRYQVTSLQEESISDLRICENMCGICLLLEQKDTVLDTGLRIEGNCVFGAVCGVLVFMSCCSIVLTARSLAHRTWRQAPENGSKHVFQTKKLNDLCHQFHSSLSSIFPVDLWYTSFWCLQYSALGIWRSWPYSLSGHSASLVSTHSLTTIPFDMNYF